MNAAHLHRCVLLGQVSAALLGQQHLLLRVDTQQMPSAYAWLLSPETLLCMRQTASPSSRECTN